jgi:hypothetical protein
VPGQESRLAEAKFIECRIAPAGEAGVHVMLGAAVPHEQDGGHGEPG